MTRLDENPDHKIKGYGFKTHDVTILGMGKCGSQQVLSVDTAIMKRNDVEVMVCHSKDFESPPSDDVIKITWNDKFSIEDDHKLTMSEKIDKLDEHFYIIEDLTFGTNVFILAAGIGGVAGSHGASKISEFFSPSWAKIVAFAVMPFKGEGERANNDAIACLEDLKRFCDVVVIVSNQQLLKIEPHVTLGQGFKLINSLFDQTAKKVIEAHSRDSLEFALDDPYGLSSIYINKNPRRDAERERRNIYDD